MNLVFYGRDGSECEDFIASVTRAAFDERRPRDWGWMADLAATAFRGDALRWWSALDDGTQSDFRKLRNALLDKYPVSAYVKFRAVNSVAHLSSNDREPPLKVSAIPTPAAAPPPVVRHESRPDVLQTILSEETPRR